MNIHIVIIPVIVVCSSSMFSGLHHVIQSHSRNPNLFQVTHKPRPDKGHPVVRPFPPLQRWWLPHLPLLELSWFKFDEFWRRNMEQFLAFHQMMVYGGCLLLFSCENFEGTPLLHIVRGWFGFESQKNWKYTATKKGKKRWATKPVP